MERKVPALEYQATPRTIADGKYSSLQGDDEGNLKVSIAGAAAGISLGGSSVGGGNSTYSTDQGDFTATPTTGAKTITITGLPTALSAITTVNFINAVIKRVSSAGVVDTLPTTNIAYVNGTGVLTLSGMAANFAAGDTVSVMLVGPDKAISGVYNATPPTLPDGARGDLQVDSSGATIVNPKALNKTDDTITAFPKGCNMSVISNTTAVTIGAGAASDTKLRAIRILAALTGTCAITGFADSDGTAQTITIPAASVGDFDFRGAKNSAGALTVTCSNASDDNLVCVFWETNTDPE